MFVAAAVSFVTCVSETPPPLLKSLWHVSADFLDDSEHA